jgi:hypothetical protein
LASEYLCDKHGWELSEEDFMEVKKKWIQRAIKRPGRCTPAPNPDCPKGSPQYNLAMRFKGGEFKKKKKD